MYIANLAFLLNYGDGFESDEIESEILRVAWQARESQHYDRIMGAGFHDLEQEPNNFFQGVMFTSHLIESVYYVNQERNFNPYILVGYSDISIEDILTPPQDGDFFVTVNYSVLQDMTNNGSVQL